MTKVDNTVMSDNSVKHLQLGDKAQRQPIEVVVKLENDTLSTVLSLAN